MMSSVSASRTESGAASLLRRTVVTASYVVCLVGSVIGAGVFGGTPISEAAGGLLATDTTPLAPGGPAFSIWSVIYTGLGAYTVWQWTDRDDPRRLGWLVTASLLLNAAWIGVVQAGWVWASVVVIVVLLAVLAEIFRRLVRTRPRSRVAAVVVDGTLGLYLGWVSVAVCANTAAALAGSGFEGFGAPVVWAVVVLAVVAAVGVAMAVVGDGRLGVGAALVWGLAWIAVARTTGDLQSTPVAVAAGIAAAVVLLATLTLRVRAVRAGSA